MPSFSFKGFGILDEQVFEHTAIVPEGIVAACFFRAIAGSAVFSQQMLHPVVADLPSVRKAARSSV